MFKSRDSPLRFGWLIALPLFELALCARASRSHCQLHRKRESQHHVIG
jgi:hypothetical protein